VVGTSQYTVVAQRAGSGTLADTTVPAAGVYEYVTRLVDVAGNSSTYSSLLKITIF
jgi:hypothetical protein